MVMQASPVTGCSLIDVYFNFGSFAPSCLSQPGHKGTLLLLLQLSPPDLNTIAWTRTNNTYNAMIWPRRQLP